MRALLFGATGMVGQPAGRARTEHRAWFAAASALARSPFHRGFRVFPAGAAWLPYPP